MKPTGKPAEVKQSPVQHGQLWFGPSQTHTRQNQGWKESGKSPGCCRREEYCPVSHSWARLERAAPGPCRHLEPEKNHRCGHSWSLKIPLCFSQPWCWWCFWLCKLQQHPPTPASPSQKVMQPLGMSPGRGKSSVKAQRGMKRGWGETQKHRHLQ